MVKVFYANYFSLSLGLGDIPVNRPYVSILYKFRFEQVSLCSYTWSEFFPLLWYIDFPLKAMNSSLFTTTRHTSLYSPLVKLLPQFGTYLHHKVHCTLLCLKCIHANRRALTKCRPITEHGLQVCTECFMSCLPTYTRWLVSVTFVAARIVTWWMLNQSASVRLRYWYHLSLSLL
jgi:hypothetical protein